MRVARKYRLVDLRAAEGDEADFVAAFVEGFAHGEKISPDSDGARVYPNLAPVLVPVHHLLRIVLTEF